MRTFSGDQPSGRFLGGLVKNNILFQRIRFSVVSVTDVSLQVVERVTVYDGIWQDDVANSSCDLREHIRLALAEFHSARNVGAQERTWPCGVVI
jgi:hypothetical protein